MILDGFEDVFGDNFGRFSGSCLGHVWEIFGWNLRGVYTVLGEVIAGQKIYRKPIQIYTNLIQIWEHQRYSKKEL